MKWFGAVLSWYILICFNLPTGIKSGRYPTVQHINDMTVHVGDNVTATCRVFDIVEQDLKTLVWLINDGHNGDMKKLPPKLNVSEYQIVPREGRRAESGIKIFFTNVTFEDQGEYTCQFIRVPSKADHRSSSFFLKVLPRINTSGRYLTVQPINDTTVHVGDNVTVTCRVFDFLNQGLKTLVWLINDVHNGDMKKLPPKLNVSEYQIVPREGRRAESGIKIFFTTVTFKDKREYTCQFIRKLIGAGHRSSSFFLKVLPRINTSGRFLTLQPINDMIVHVGENVKVTCRVFDSLNQGLKTLVWLINDGHNGDMKKLPPKLNVSEYQIVPREGRRAESGIKIFSTNVTFKDQMEYTCQFIRKSSKAGHRSSSFFLRVLPRINTSGNTSSTEPTSIQTTESHKPQPIVEICSGVAAFIVVIGLMVALRKLKQRSNYRLPTYLSFSNSSTRPRLSSSLSQEDCEISGLENINLLKVTGKETFGEVLRSEEFDVTGRSGETTVAVKTQKGFPSQWEPVSKVHRDKYEKLLKCLQDPENSLKIEKINGVQVCFDEEFKIGEGADGTSVYIGLSEDGCERAVKRLLKTVSGKLGLQEKIIVNTLNAVNSEYIVTYRFYDDESDPAFAYLILDLCEETLEQYVKNQSQEKLVKNAPIIIRQVLEALDDLHRKPKPILHRDLKPSNIMRNVYDKWLLADFGLSRTLPEGQTTHRSVEKGTKFWRAVESYPITGLGNSNSKEVRYKRKSDTQAAALVAFHVLTKGEHVFGPERDRLGNLLDGKPVGLASLTDPVAKDLISWMVQHKPEDRPYAHEALKHPYILTPDQQFELLTCVGNEVEIKDTKALTSSDVAKKINADPLLPKSGWISCVDSNLLQHVCQGSRPYPNQWTQCLRFMRNTSVHWNDKAKSAAVQNVMREPQEYFLKLFPTLPVVVHRIIRSDRDWKEKGTLKKFF